MKTLSVNDFRESAEQGWLKQTVSELFELFNYTQKCTTEQNWSEVTMEARGVVFQGEQVVCRPMRKFFNSHEPFGLKLLESATPNIALVKLDGTLINVWFDLQGEMHVSTRGSLSNEYIDGAWELIRSRGLEAMLSLHKDVTWSFEYTYPQERFSMPSVIPHKDERLTLLNMRMRDGSELDAEIIPEFNQVMYGNKDYYYNLSVSSEDSNLIEQMEGLAKLLPWENEGWVLSEFDGNSNQRVKVKGSQYVTMHRVIHGMTPRSIADAWYGGMNNKLVAMLYEPHSSILQEKFDAYDSLMNKTVTEVTEWVAGYRIVNKEFSRKDFVIQAQRKFPKFGSLQLRRSLARTFRRV